MLFILILHCMSVLEKKTILLVEDNEMMRKALLETLRVLNYDALGAANGAEALNLLENIPDKNPASQDKKVDLIMSDLSMPQMDGQELFREIRKRGWNIPLVLLTGYMVTNELDELMKDGLAGWLQKPADIEQISVLLKNILH